MDGVLLVGHGTVTDLADIPAFLTRIRRGRPASAALIADVVGRYRAIGGSPFLNISRAQATALSDRVTLPVLLGMRMWEPSIEAALKEATTRGLQRLCVLPLAPFSVHVYAGAVREALATLAIRDEERPELVEVRPWGMLPELVDAHATLIASHLGDRAPDSTRLVLSAHSLPSVVIEHGDPYQEQFEAMAHAIFQRLGGEGTLAYQSQGADGGRWLGPDVRTTLDRIASEGFRRVVWAPVGFLADHVETLYDLDVEAAAWAKELGLELTRVPALNLERGLISAMATAVRHALGDADHAPGEPH